MQRLKVLLTTACLLAASCAWRERRPEGPYREAQEFVDALSDLAVQCAQEHAPQGTGAVVVAAEFTGAGKLPVILDGGSMPGSEALIACVAKRASESLRCPRTAPARFATVRLPVPLVTSQVTYAFADALGS